MKDQNTDQDLLSDAASWGDLEESNATGTQGGIKVGDDVKSALSKIMGAEGNGVRAALMTALDNDEQLVNDVLNKVGSELAAFLPQVLGKNAK